MTRWGQAIASSAPGPGLAPRGQGKKSRGKKTGDEEEDEEEEEEGEEDEEEEEGEGSDSSMGRVLGGEGCRDGGGETGATTATTPSSSSIPPWGKGFCTDEREYLKTSSRGGATHPNEPPYHHHYHYHPYYDTSEGDLITDLGNNTDVQIPLILYYDNSLYITTLVSIIIIIINSMI